MKFYIPHADSEEQAENVWTSVRQFLAQQGYGTTERRISSISFRHNGKAYSVEVGEIFPDLREQVVAILEGLNPGLCYICTPMRGVVRGEPYLVGRDQHTRITDFDL